MSRSYRIGRAGRAQPTSLDRALQRDNRPATQVDDLLDEVRVHGGDVLAWRGQAQRVTKSLPMDRGRSSWPDEVGDVRRQQPRVRGELRRDADVRKYLGQLLLQVLAGDGRAQEGRQQVLDDQEQVIHADVLIVARVEEGVLCKQSVEHQTL